MKEGLIRMRFFAQAAAVLLAFVASAAPSFAQTRPSLIVAVPSELRGTDPHKISAGSDDNVFGNVSKIFTSWTSTAA